MADDNKNLISRVNVIFNESLKNLISTVTVLNENNANLVSRVTANYSMPHDPGDNLDNPDHALFHRIIAINQNAPLASVGVDGDGNVVFVGSITGNSLITAQNIGIAADTDLIQLTGANVVVINGSLGVGTTNPIYPLDCRYPFGKTDTTTRNAFRLGSNDVANPFSLIFEMTGAASQTDRIVSIYTTEQGVSNTGSLVLQQFGGKVGIGIAAPVKLVHIYEGASGQSSAVSGTNLIIESNDITNYITFLSPNTSFSGVVFGDPEDSDVAYMLYHHSNDEFTWRTNGGAASMVLGSGGEVFMSAVYSDDVGAARDLLIKSDGQLGWTASSIQYKERVRNLVDNDTAWIHNIRVVKYDRKDGSAIDEIGGIAEEMNLVNSNMVSYKRIKGVVQEDGKDVYHDTGEPESIEKSRLIFPTIREVQKLRRDLDAHING